MNEGGLSFGARQSLHYAARVQGHGFSSLQRRRVLYGDQQVKPIRPRAPTTLQTADAARVGTDEAPELLLREAAGVAGAEQHGAAGAFGPRERGDGGQLWLGQ